MARSRVWRGGISVFGDSILVEYMHVRSNGSHGISVGALDTPFVAQNQIVQHNNVQQNGQWGINVGGGLVSDNVSTQNHVDGVSLVQGLCSNNTLMSNGRIGLHCSGGSHGNVMQSNATNVSGGVNLGQNLCDGTACPGAVF